MRSDLDDALVRDFPALYRDRNGDRDETRRADGSPGDGWEPLIRRMSETIEPFCVATDLRAAQVKEKGGVLRVYLNSGEPLPHELRAAIRSAEEQSRRTCEGCGAAGTTRRLRWIRTLCGDCATFAAEWERLRFGDSPADEKWRELFRGESERILNFEDALRRWHARERR
jgi:hypothetical protein